MDKVIELINIVDDSIFECNIDIKNTYLFARKVFDYYSGK